MKRAQPKEVRKIYCRDCGELMIKLYPYTDIPVADTTKFLCTKCIAKVNEKKTVNT